MVGYSPEDLQAGQVRWRDMIAPEYIEASNSAIAELKTKGVCQAFEKKYIRKDDSRVPILLGSALLENNPNDIISFVLDLSERKQVELALCKSEERYRTFLEQSSEQERELLPNSCPMYLNASVKLTVPARDRMVD